jgi:hypothetical protein
MILFASKCRKCRTVTIPRTDTLCLNCCLNESCSKCSLTVRTVQQYINEPIKCENQEHEWIVNLWEQYSMDTLTASHSSVAKCCYTQFFTTETIEGIQQLYCQQCLKGVVQQIVKNRNQVEHRECLPCSVFPYNSNVLDCICKFLPMPQAIVTLMLVCKFWRDSFESGSVCLRNLYLVNYVDEPESFHQLFGSFRMINHRIDSYLFDRKLDLPYLLDKLNSKFSLSIESWNFRSTNLKSETVVLLLSEYCTTTINHIETAAFTSSVYGYNELIKMVNLDKLKSIRHNSTVVGWNVIELNRLIALANSLKELFIKIPAALNPASSSLTKLILQSAPIDEFYVRYLTIFPHVTHLNILNCEFDVNDLELAITFIDKFPAVLNLYIPFLLGLTKYVSMKYNSQLLELIMTRNYNNSDTLTDDEKHELLDEISTIFVSCPNLKGVSLYSDYIEPSKIITAISDRCLIHKSVTSFSLISGHLVNDEVTTDLSSDNIESLSKLFPNIHTLELYGYNLGGTKTFFKIFNTSESLGLENSIICAIAKYIPSLKHLALTSCLNQYIIIKSSIGKLKNLRTLLITRSLNLGNSQYPMKYLSECSELRQLHISGHNLNVKDNIDYFSKLQHLRYLFAYVHAEEELVLKQMFPKLILLY